jgi:hypothetical protein
MNNKIKKTTLLNIDSSHRNLYAKNIYNSDNKILPPNPLEFKINSNKININYPNHNLKIGDKIILQNVEGMTRIIGNNFFLVNNFKYLVIILENIGIDINYKKYVDSLYINIEIYGNQTINNMIDNIPLNALLGINKIFITSDIPSIEEPTEIAKLLNVYQKIFPNLNITDLINISNNVLFIELPYYYISQENNLIALNQVFKISYLHISGIELGYLNANYPINNNNYQSYHEVTNIINSNVFEIQVFIKPYMNIIGGGTKVQVMKIINTITGYPNANNYVITLKKSFNNVTNIELVSTEFPYIDLIIKKDINDKLYWKHLNDGPYIYSVQIDEGSYNPSTLLLKIQNKINNVKRITSTDILTIYNIFNIEFETNAQSIIFKSYENIKLPNSLLIKLETINNYEYYILRVIHKNNIIKIGDIITISNAIDTTFKIQNENDLEFYLISSNYINGDKEIYNININDQTYDIILGLKEEIIADIVNNNNNESQGGDNIIVKIQAKISFLFDKLDTIGDVIGFKNVGDPSSITAFNSIISNKDPYIYSNNLDQVGNIIDYSSKFINLGGKYNYFLMYLNDIEYIYNNTLPSSFAKILLSGNPGDILFNTFVKYPNELYSNVFPINTLTELTINFLYPDGKQINFRNIEHSFTIKIVEEINT